MSESEIKVRVGSTYTVTNIRGADVLCEGDVIKVLDFSIGGDIALCKRCGDGKEDVLRVRQLAPVRITDPGVKLWFEEA